MPKNWCFRTVVLEKTLESHLESKEIKPVNLKGNQPWIPIRRTDAEAEVPYFGHLIQGADSLEKTLVLGKNGGRRRRGQQRMRAGWLHRYNGHELGQTPGDAEGREAWCAAVHEVSKSRTWLGDWTTTTSIPLFVYEGFGAQKWKLPSLHN